MTPGDIARQTRRALAGLCYRCESPALPDRALCERHRAEMRDYRRKRRGDRPNKRGMRCSECGSDRHIASGCEKGKR